MKELVLSKQEAGQRLDKYLNKVLPSAGSGFLYKMLRKKNITLNGKKATGKEVLQAEDTIQVFFAEDTFEKFSAGKHGDHPSAETNGESGKRRKSPSGSHSGDNVCPIRNASVQNVKEPGFFKILDQQILLQSEDIMIINKPSGVLTQKAKPGDQSVNDWALSRIPAAEGFKPSVLNRLDRNTSGIVCISKSMKGAQVISKALKERTMHKYYRTLVFGTDVPEGVMQASISKDHRTNQVTVGDEGDAIETGITVLGEGKIGEEPISYLEILLITGKTHQIRAHLAALGHPVLGDPKYGIQRKNQRLKEAYKAEEQLLHACRLEAPEEVLGGF
ncbi:MAG: RluA family pseudouridine synthase, partial [Lachnospiraceae bacterium]|nr:RluA family pseudouridine synthase [Lachnospiraceae bacterium]